MHPEFIDSAALAKLVGISERAARKVIAAGKIQGDPIQITTVDGTRSHGGRMRLVQSSSLPAHLQQRLNEIETPKELPTGGRDVAEHNWKLDVIRPILAQERGTSTRAAEFERLIGTTRIDWTGNSLTLSKSSLYRWVETFESSGGAHVCLSKKPRKDKGKARVIIRKEWDREVPFDAATCEAIRHDIKQYLRGLIKDGGQRKVIMTLAGNKLREITAAYGFSTLSKQAATIPLDFYREEMHLQEAYRRKHDRKASEDNQPRIRRTIDGLEPMEIVVMDVHHINVRVLREDGTTATPKLIAFHDIATNRVFCEIIMFENNGGVRNADIITAFINMCQHKSFGVPKALYVDNGSEYRFADDLKDALELGCKIVGFDGIEGRNRVIRAKAYNAAAKHVEGWFRQMNQQYIRHIPGWIDDDRMNPKRPEMGKLPAPFSSGFDAFCTQFYAFLKAYEHMPQQGALEGSTPAASFQRHVDAQWKATLMNPTDLVTVFTTPKSKPVRKHGIEHAKQFWTCDGLTTYFGRRVFIHIPKYHGYSALRVTDENGKEIGIAHADQAYEVLDPRGAKESARRSSLRNKALRELDKSVPDISMADELTAFAQRQEDVVPNEPDGIISVNQQRNTGLALPPVPTSKPEIQKRQTESEARRDAEARRKIFDAMNRKAS